MVRGWVRAQAGAFTDVIAIQTTRHIATRKVISGSPTQAKTPVVKPMAEVMKWDIVFSLAVPAM